MGYELIDVVSPQDWRAFHDIRRRELFEAKGRFGIYDEHHPHDALPDNHPYLLKLDGQPLAVARLDIWPDAAAVFRLVAVTASEQGKGHGRVLDQMISARAKSYGTRIFQVNAVRSAVGFYRATGWSEFLWDADELARAGVACVQMRKML